ncbi:MAG: acetyltransferase [Cellvibrionaceae bacterium]|nr:acetyltransferase [Cellvibrionaceae bacterium]
MVISSSSEQSLDWRQLAAVISYPDGRRIESVFADDFLMQMAVSENTNHHWALTTGKAGVELEWVDHRPPQTEALLAALDSVFTLHPLQREIVIFIPGVDTTEWQQSGFVLPGEAGQLKASRELLWQQPRLWMPQVPAPMPLQYMLSEGRRHPARRPKPQGLVYQRFIPWLDKTFTLRTLDLEKDLARFNRWMNDPEVARHWHEEGDLAQHRDYLQSIKDNPHMYTLIGCLDEEPFAYFEIYWATENRIGAHYEAQDYDRGWHVLIGESAFRGKAFATVWLTSIAHYMFLDDPRTQRIVGEPNVNHSQQLRNLDLTGYSRVKTFDFPHKKAQLVMLLREHYFANSLWWPRVHSTHPAATPIPEEIDSTRTYQATCSG